MLLLNFSHPVTAAQRAELFELLGADDLTVRDIPAQLDAHAPFEPQVVALVEACSLTPEQWQTEPLIVNPPGLSVLAAALLAELHGRMGYFPSVLRLRPVQGSVPPRFEVAQVVNLHALRAEARTRR